MTVSVHIVTWNSQSFLPALRRSLESQTHQPERIIVIDNNSTDGTLDGLADWPGIHVLRQTRNLGFARAHNQAINLSRSQAVLVTNPDVILEPSCLAALVDALERDLRLGSVTPKIRRFSHTSDDLREPVRSATIDAAGMVVRRSRQALNRAEGSDDRGQVDQPIDVFGAPGVLALYRRQALNDVAFGREYFDEDFFAYKEDVDVAWRLRWAGWGSRYVPAARAYHYRTLDHHQDRLTKLVATRSRRSPTLRYLSYRNHLLMLIKNETIGTLLPHLPFIAWYELRKFLFAAVREWSTLRGLVDALRLAPRMLRKRRVVTERRRLSASSMRRLISP
ncbi:MAG: glycosyltransferase family 2 protein [Candidatus Kerfeldbacteria bacterium]|nr:glycosyltransferase family 2 protein [Candidatus Kerfeldbacteria bacterium]